MKKIFVIFIFIIGLLPSNVYAQIIDKLRIIPEIPLNSDIINLECNAFFETDGAKLDSSKIIINDWNIVVTGYYSRSGAARPDQSKDTIPIGKLSSGSFKLVYFLKDVWGGVDTDSINFTVGVNKTIKQENQKLIIFPNPCNNLLTLCLPDKEKYLIALFNTLGQCIDKLELEGKSNYELPLPYAKGLYYLNATSSHNLTYKVLLSIE